MILFYWPYFWNIVDFNINRYAITLNTQLSTSLAFEITAERFCCENAMLGWVCRWRLLRHALLLMLVHQQHAVYCSSSSMYWSGWRWWLSWCSTITFRCVLLLLNNLRVNAFMYHRSSLHIRYGILDDCKVQNRMYSTVVEHLERTACRALQLIMFTTSFKSVLCTE